MAIPTEILIQNVTFNIFNRRPRWNACWFQLSTPPWGREGSPWSIQGHCLIKIWKDLCTELFLHEGNLLQPQHWPGEGWGTHGMAGPIPERINKPTPLRLETSDPIGHVQCRSAEPQPRDSRRGIYINCMDTWLLYHKIMDISLIQSPRSMCDQARWGHTFLALTLTLFLPL